MNISETLKPGAHDAVQQLLPWFVNGSLAEDQAAQVRAHLDVCEVCQADAGWDARIHAAAPLAPELDAERALARLMPRLTAQTAPAGIVQRLRDWWSASSWMPYALAGQCALIAGLGVVVFMQQAPDGAYRALGNGEQAGGNVVVMFQPGAAVSDVQRMMQSSQARIVNGPTVAGAYVLQVAPERQAAALAALRANPGVMLAEPLAPEQP